MKNKTPRNDLPVTELGDGVYLLDEFGSSNCYLITGSTGALLIDCGTGFCDMRGAVRKITDLPLTVAVTHGHVDHFGGAGQFPEIYVPEKDCGKINMFQRKKAVRAGVILANKELREKGFAVSDLMDPEYDTKIIPFGEDKIFDLGGKTITVHATPGHTVGSVAFIDEKDGFIFSGDNVCDALWMFVPGGTSIEEWVPGAEWLYEKAADYRVFWGHRTPELTREYIGKVIGYGKELLSVTRKNTVISKIAQYPKQPDGIIYLTGKVFKK